MHCHEYAFWLRKYDLDGFSARVREIKRERPPSEERKTRVETRPLPFRAAQKEVERSKNTEKPRPIFLSLLYLSCWLDNSQDPKTSFQNTN